jgi:hypothetical protein
MKEISVCNVFWVLFLGAAVATSAVVGDWWKHWITPGASAIHQELVAPQKES